MAAAFGAPAYAQAPAIVGAWSCEPLANVREEGGTSLIQGNPIFSADGSYSEEMTGTMEFRGHVLSTRAVISGRWRLGEPDHQLHYEIQDSAVQEVILDGKSLAPAMFDSSFGKAMMKPHATNISVEDDTLLLEWDDRSLSCQRLPGEALS